MTDLVERLRYAARGELFGDTTLEEAADRITELEAKLANFESDAYVLSLLTRIDELEAQYAEWRERADNFEAQLEAVNDLQTYYADDLRPNRLVVRFDELRKATGNK